MENIGGIWVITQKKSHDGQKTLCKARLVAGGLQEEIKPQSDSPTASRNSFKLMVALSANEGFKIVSIYILAAFLQAKILDCDFFMFPLVDIRKQGKVWKLLKLLYGLDGASRKFWLKVRKLFLKMGLKTLEGDEAFYFLDKGGLCVTPGHL